MPDRFASQVLAPSNCSVDDLTAFCALVNLGNRAAHLSPDWLVDHALKLHCLRVEDSLVAVGGLKKPQRAYHRQCFRKAGVADRWDEFPVELGWIYCRNDFRGGMASRIIDPLLKQPEAGFPMYAIVRVENHLMTGPLIKRGFGIIGGTYPSLEHPEEMVELLVREAR